MKAKWKSIQSNAALILWVITVVTGVSGFSIVGGIDYVRRIDGLLDRAEQLERKVATQDSMLYAHKISIKMAFELDRIMTDNNDTIIYYIVDSRNNEYEVDIRNNNEGYQIAFVFGLNVSYPVRTDPADNRKYIVLHDASNHTQYGTYIFEKQ